MAADEGVFLTSDGASLDWAYSDRRDAKTEVKRARQLLEQGQAEVAAAELALAAARDTFRLAAMADAVGALLVCGVMARAAWELFGESLPDLLDRSIDRVARPALERAAAILPAGFAVAGFRSRGSPHAFAVEVTLACPPTPAWALSRARSGR
jgi:hypothetical protein